MKLSQLSAVLISLASGFSKHRRSTPVFSLTGDENVDQLDDILATVTNGTVDDIEAAILANMGEGFGLGRRTTAVEERKFRNLKILVLFLQSEKKFGKYCYYGCHCLPEGSHDLAQGGFGVPKDNIDRSCRRFGQCYKCLLEEHKDDEFDISGNTICKGEEIGYQADLVDDPNGFNGRSIICLNKVNDYWISLSRKGAQFCSQSHFAVANGWLAENNNLNKIASLSREEIFHLISFPLAHNNAYHGYNEIY